MRITADTNTFLAVAFGEQEKEPIIKATAKAKLISPEILPYEIGNAISKMVRRDLISATNALKSFSITQQIPVELNSINIENALNISSKFKIYSYDAYFLQCAIENNTPILSLDRQLIRIANSLNIKVIQLS